MHVTINFFSVLLYCLFFSVNYEDTNYFYVNVMQYLLFNTQCVIFVFNHKKMNQAASYQRSVHFIVSWSA